MSYKSFMVEITPGEILTLYEALNSVMDEEYIAEDALALKKKLEEAFRRENNL